MRLFSPSYAEFRLKSRLGSRSFLALLALLALMWEAETIKIAAVAAFGSSTNVAAVQRGLALDPNNAQLHHRLSQLCGDSLTPSSLTERVAQAQRAISLNPNKPDYWLNLASACESIHDDACADRSIQRTLVLCPSVPLVWWTAGNLYLRTNQPETALSCFRRLLELNPDYAAATLGLTFRVYADPKMIFEKVIGGGSDPKLALAYADFMSANNELDAAYQAWSQVASRGSSFTFAAVRPYLEQLLSHGRFQQAHAVWMNLEQRGTVGKPQDREQGNLVFNGGFEQAPLGAGFDWGSQPSPYVAVDFADPSAYEGARCLRVDFLANQNADFEPVWQTVLVAPGRAYTLAAYVRTSDITSDCGPQLKVVDPNCYSCLNAFTKSTNGTTAWHSVQTSFSTESQTRAVRVSVWRARCRTFPMDISGSFWLDQVSLRLTASTQ